VLAPVKVRILRRSGPLRVHVTQPSIGWRPALYSIICELKAARVDPNSVVETPPENGE